MSRCSSNERNSCGNRFELDAIADDTIFNPRLGLGSTDNENIALRRNHREKQLLFRKQKMLGLEQEYVMKMVDLNSKTTQVNYRRLTKRVSRIHSHLTEDEIKEMENDARKAEFANKYRNILRNQTIDDNQQSERATTMTEDDDVTSHDNPRCRSAASTVTKTDNSRDNEQWPSKRKIDNQTSYGQRSNPIHTITKNDPRRPKTCPNSGTRQEPESDAVEEIIPSLEGLLDQLHNIKPQQFYENQRKLKLYDIQLLLEEFEGKKQAFYRDVDAIINWDKKKEVDEEEEERKKKEEEETQKPQKRKTTFMRSVLRNFSMELMMKTMQYGWTDLGKCRYLRRRGGDDEGDEGSTSMNKNNTKTQMTDTNPDKNPPPSPSKIEPGFGPDGKMIRTADLLGLKSE